MGGAPKPPPIPPPPPIPLPEGPEEREARQRQRMAAAAMKGRQSTLLTGPMGLKTQAPVQVKKLFGE
jgi:hypothetical protein